MRTASIDLDPSRTDGFDLTDHLCAAGTVGEARDALLELAGEAPAQRPESSPDTAGLLDAIAATIRKYVVLSDEQAVA